MRPCMFWMLLVATLFISNGLIVSTFLMILSMIAILTAWVHQIENEKFKIELNSNIQKSNGRESNFSNFNPSPYQSISKNNSTTMNK